MDNIQIANEIIDYIGENPVPIKSIDEICQDIIEKLQLQVDYDTLYQALEGIYNQSTPSGGYTLQDFINEGGKLGRSDIDANLLTEIKKLNFTNVADCSYMFYQTYWNNQTVKLTLPSSANSNDMRYMFGTSYNLDYLDLSECQMKPSSLQSTFGSGSLKMADLTGIDISQCTTLTSAFNGCSNLTWLDITGWNCTNVGAVTSVFNGCNQLTTIIGNHTLAEVEAGTVTTFNGFNKANFNISNWTAPIERKDLLSIIKGLGSTSTTRTISFSAAHRALLTSDDIAIATGKGWYVQ